MKWEYLISHNEDELNDLGNQGWELVAVILKQSKPQLFLKRPKPKLKERITSDQRESVYKNYGLEGTL